MILWCKKICYKTKQLAKKAIIKINKSNTNRKPLITVYYCIECEAWHTTSMAKQSSRNYTRKLNKRK